MKTQSQKVGGINTYIGCGLRMNILKLQLKYTLEFFAISNVCFRLLSCKNYGLVHILDTILMQVQGTSKNVCIRILPIFLPKNYSLQLATLSPPAPVTLAIRTGENPTARWGWFQPELRSPEHLFPPPPAAVPSPPRPL